VTVLSIVVGVAFTPWITRRLGKVRAVVWASILRSVLLTAWYLVGWDSLLFSVLIVSLMGLSMAPWIVHLTTMIGDSIDWVEVETAQRHEGVAFSLQTLSAKVSTGLGALVTGAVLTFTGFVANQGQTPEALHGIFLMLTIIPAVSSLLSILPFRWYPITEEAHAAVVRQLEEARRS